MNYFCFTCTNPHCTSIAGAADTRVHLTTKYAFRGKTNEKKKGEKKRNKGGEKGYALPGENKWKKEGEKKRNKGGERGYALPGENK